MPEESCSPPEDAARPSTDALPQESSVEANEQPKPESPSSDPGPGASVDGTTPPASDPTVRVGDRVRGKIVSFGAEHCFVSYGGSSEAVLPTSELLGPDDRVLLRVGDSISATVKAEDDPVVLTLGRKRGVLHAARLRIASEEGATVSGVVLSANKGGFEVRVGGVRAFCPVSQIDTTTVQDATEYVGQKLQFHILRWERGGRNIVLSRRALLREKDEKRAEETRKHLEVGAEFEGSITRVQAFGAFVDIGGLEGLLHVSRLGQHEVQDATQVLRAGQKIRVRVTGLENTEDRKERISLAAAEAGPDPWDENGEALREGEVLTGRAVRLAPFGVFVNLVPGIDGLVHISELRGRRVQADDESMDLKPGEEIQVRILHVDRAKRRVSLSIQQARENRRSQPTRTRTRRPRGDNPNRDRDRESGSTGSLTHTMADQLGALRRKLQKKT